MELSADSLRHDDKALNQTLCFGLFLICHIVIWTAYATASNNTIHHDMAEAWVWGQEFQAGYYKHPPLFAWVTGIWFHFLPRETWSFYLLSALNSAIALIGVWFLASQFLKGAERWAAVLLLYFTPFYSFLALKFNANSALLAIWPWASYFFVRALQTHRTRDGLCFGILCALAMLAKYYSILFLASCALASVLHPQRRTIWNSPAPYMALLGCSVVLAPHLWWVVHHGFPTVDYALQKSHRPRLHILKEAVVATIGALLFQVLPFAVLIGATRANTLEVLQRLSSFLSREKTAWIAVMCFGPYVLTVICGFAGITEINTEYMIPIFYMVPLVVLLSNPHLIDATALKKIIAGIAVVMMAAGPTAALLTAWGVLSERGKDEPRLEVVTAALRVWRDTTDKPLKIVAGSFPYDWMVSFYSPESPSDFIDFDYSHAPWISPERIAQQGMLVVCEETDGNCLQNAVRFNRATRFKEEFACGRNRSIKTFVFFVLAPLGT